MKQFIFLLLILSFSNIYAFSLFADSDRKDIWSCSGLTDTSTSYIKTKWEKLEEQAERRDVEYQIQTLSVYYKSFCRDKELVKEFDTRATKAIKKGMSSELNLMKDEIARISKYRLPQTEWERLAEFAKKNGKSREEILTKSEYDEIVNSNEKERMARQSSCKSTDNRKAPLKGKIRDQDGIGWCYAYTAADLISHHTGKLISAVDIANSYNNSSKLGSWLGDKILSTPESEQESGFIGTAIENAVEKGLCLENDTRSSDFTFQNFKTLHEALQELEELKNNFDNETDVKSNWWDSNSEISKRQKEEKIRDFVGDCSVLDGEWRQIFKTITSDEIVEVLRESGPVDVINKMIDKNCKNRIKSLGDIEVVDKRTGMFTESDEIISEMDEQLNKGNIVGIMYKSSLLLDAYDDKTSNHASSIVARKYDPKSGSCKYLVRNSWGEGCGGYDSRYECDKGEVWIGHEDLTRMIYGINYIKE